MSCACTRLAAQALSCSVFQFSFRHLWPLAPPNPKMPRPVPMALDSEVEEGSPTTASKEFEAVCFKRSSWGVWACLGFWVVTTNKSYKLGPLLKQETQPSHELAMQIGWYWHHHKAKPLLVTSSHRGTDSIDWFHSMSSKPPLPPKWRIARIPSTSFIHSLFFFATVLSWTPWKCFGGCHGRRVRKEGKLETCLVQLVMPTYERQLQSSLVLFCF